MEIPSASNSWIEIPASDVQEKQYTLVARREFSWLWVVTRHGRRFLLKGLPPVLRNRPEMRALLEKEFELCIRIDHPSVVRVYGFEDNPELGPVIVMEYFDGFELGEYLKSSPKRSERVRIAAELANVLEYVHGLGVAHRDLKPDNILIGKVRGDMRLIDFGLGDSDDSTLFKQSKATRKYGAPEQIEGTEGDARSDVYSFGRILSGMRLPLLYGGIIRKCLRPQPSSRPTMRNVNERLRTTSRLYRRLPLVSVALFALLSAGAAFYFAFSGNNVRQEERAVVNDSVAARPVAVMHDTVIMPAASEANAQAGNMVAAPDVSRKDNAAIVTGEYNKVLSDYIAKGRKIVTEYESRFRAPGADVLKVTLARSEAVNRLAAEMDSRLDALDADEGIRAQLKAAFWTRLAEMQNVSDSKRNGAN